MTSLARLHAFGLAFAFALPGAVGAQYTGQQTSGQMPAQAPVAAACQQGAQQALAVLDDVKAGLDRARLNNDPVEMRTAMDALQAAVSEIKTRLDACRVGGRQMPAVSGQLPAMDHSKMSTGGAAPAGTPATQPGSPPPAAGAPATRPQMPMGGMDHSKMVQPTTPSGGAPATGGMDHSKMGHGTATAETTMPADAVDPVCRTKPSPRFKAEYKGQTYYFCSEADRQKFVAAPEKHLKKE